MVAKSIEMYTDGSALNNPGLAGYGFIIRYWTDSNYAIEKQISVGKAFSKSTNNRMEIMGVLNGLKRVIEEFDNKLFEGVNQVDVYSDSKYIVNTINAGWLRNWMQNNWMTSGYKGKAPGPVKNKDLWEDFLTVEDELKKRQIKYTISFIKGHDGLIWNEAVDKLATTASKNGPYEVDEGFEQSNKYR